MMGRPRKLSCDGTVADYKRHRRRGEDACPQSKRAWSEYMRKLRASK